MPIIEEAHQIYRVPVYSPFGAETTNAYLLTGERLGVLDPGTGHPRTHDDLTEALRSLGREPEQVDVVLISHGHLDHMGLAGAFPGAEVLVGEPDLVKVTDNSAHFKRYTASIREFVSRWGAPPALADRMDDFFAFCLGWTRSAPQAQPLRDGDLVESLGLPLRVILSPGHTEGQFALYREDDRILLSSDVLLADSDPDPALFTYYDPPVPGLQAFMDSLARLLDLQVDLVLPGHGTAFSGLETRIATIRRRHEERLLLVAGACGQGSSVYEVGQALHPELSLDNGFTILREVFGNLEILRARGMVVRAVRNGVDVYSER